VTHKHPATIVDGVATITLPGDVVLESPAEAQGQGGITIATPEGSVVLAPETLAEMLPLLHRFAQSGTLVAEKHDHGQTLWRSKAHDRMTLSFRNGILTTRDERGVIHMKPVGDLAQEMASTSVERTTIVPAVGSEVFHYGDAHAALCAVLGADRLEGVRMGWDGMYAFTHRDVFRADQMQKALALAAVLERYATKEGTQVIVDTGVIQIDIVVHVDKPYSI